MSAPVCPECGDRYIEIHEQELVTREIIGVNADGVLIIASETKRSGEFDGTRFFCNSCCHSWSLDSYEGEIDYQ